MRQSDRTGSVLLVIIGLLGLLLLLGITFYTFSAQENLSAENFAAGGKNPPAVDVDVYWDFALEQLIIGPDYANQQSALWPGRHSLIPNVLGQFDVNKRPLSSQPFSGLGVNVIDAGSGAPGIDQDHDGTVDTNLSLFRINLSPSATGAAPIVNGFNVLQPPTYTLPLPQNLPAANPGYTYPDINNLFLAFDGYDSTGINRVIIPSFHRPQYLRYTPNDVTGPSGTATTAGAPVLDWATNGGNSGTAIYDKNDPGKAPTIPTRVLRPHASHVVVAQPPGGGAPAPTAVRRFLSAPLVTTIGGRNVTVQPFPGLANATNSPTQGIWSGVGNLYNYDVDNDGDGIQDSIWLDLGFPIQDFANGGQFVPLFSFMVQDADALLNLNLTGNLPIAGTYNLNRPIYDGSQSTVPSFLSKSNLGLSPTEVSPAWALRADPVDTNNVYNPSPGAFSVPLQQHRASFQDPNYPMSGYSNPVDRFETANMELLFLLWGRGDYDVTGTGSGASYAEAFALTNLIEGRWGERSNLFSAIQPLNPTTNPKDPVPFPRPGVRAQTSPLPTDPTYAMNVANKTVLNAPYSIPRYYDAGDDEMMQSDINGKTNWGDRYEGRFYDDQSAAQAFPATPNPSPPPTSLALAVDPYLGLPPSGLNPPAFVHPLDFTGQGSSLIKATGVGLVANRIYDPTETQVAGGVAGGGFNPSRWLSYNNYQFGVGYGFPQALGVTTSSSTNFAGVVNSALPTSTTSLGQYLSTFTSSKAPFNSATMQPYQYSDIDEGDEVVVDRTYKQSSDQIFGPEEMAGLHFTDTDFQNLALTSRLQQLLPYNFLGNLQAQSIRKQFTTESWDRRQHGMSMPYYVNGQQITTNPNTNQPVFGAANTPVPGFDSKRAWEWNADTNVDSTGASLPDGRLEFPPTFVSPSGQGTFSGQTDMVVRRSEPFRRELRTILECEQSYAAYGASLPQAVARQKLRLNLNRFLSSTANDSIPVGASTNVYNGAPYYRNLTPHPQTGLANTAVQTVPSTSPVDWAATTTTPVGTVADQEFWARRDRQQMARDIYVMLYTFGGGVDGQNYTLTNAPAAGTGIRPLYTDAQLQVMAQFAVNYVDALDRDNVITVFEYDRNLGPDSTGNNAGWNLGDNPYSIADDATSATSIPGSGTADRGVVYGVEAQMLTFSEAIGIYCDKTTGTPAPNHDATAFDDSANAHHYLFAELRNASPQDIDLSNRAWRIRRVDTSLNNNPSPDPTSSNNGSTIDRRLYLYGGSVGGANIAQNTIYAGQQFTVGTSDGSDTDGTNRRASDFRVGFSDTNSSDGPFYRIVPAVPEQAPPNDINYAASSFLPASNLDLVHSRDINAGRFLLADGSSTPPAVGKFLDATTEALTPTGSAPIITLALERRVNLTRTYPAWMNSGATPPAYPGGERTDTQEADNPWVEVDRISINNPSSASPPSSASMIDFNVLDSSGTKETQPGIRVKLANLRSWERKEPLARRTGEANHPTQALPSSSALTTAMIVQSSLGNTIAGGNPNAAATLRCLPYNSNVLTAGANNPIATVGSAYFSLWQPHFDRDYASVIDLLSLPVVGPDQLTNQFDGQGSSMAGPALILDPNGTATNPAGTGTGIPPHAPNRWYRLLEFVEIPSRANRQIENYFSTLNLRIPAKLNLNTLRHSQVLGGVLDDPQQVTVDTTSTTLPTSDLVDKFENTRDWWAQFAQARDQKDQQTNLYLPGAPASRPFRNFSTLDDLAPNLPLGDPLARTLLRNLPMDVNSAPTNNPRGLFEARTASDAQTVFPQVPQVDYYTKNRLLAKLANNTTNRSNVFIVWISVGYFQAVPTPDPVTAGQVDFQIGAPIAGATTATNGVVHRGFFIVDRSQLEQAFNATTGKFDFKKFIQFRQTIQ